MNKKISVSAILFCLQISFSHASTHVGPNITAKSAIIIDAQSNKVLWELNAQKRMFPASTIKILTTLLLLEHTKLTDIIKAPKGVDEIGEASIFLTPGEQLSVKDIAHAIMVGSANDASYAAAIHVAGSVNKFSEMMNQRAAELGCKNTYVTNPHGLNDANSVTSAADLAIIAQHAMQNPIFAEIVRKPRYKLHRQYQKGKKEVINKNKLILTDKTANGIKVGWTVPAGHCYVGSATRNGHQLITVVLNSTQMFKDHEAMLQWAYQNYQWELIAAAHNPLNSLQSDKVNLTKVEIGLLKPIYAISMGKTPILYQTQYKLKKDIPLPLKKGQVIGEAIYTQKDGFAQVAPLVVLNSVKLNKSARTSTQNSFSFITLFTLALGSSALLIRKTK